MVLARTITQLKADWWKDHEAWQKRDLGNRRVLYIRTDGVHFKPRMAEEKECVLVIAGAHEDGRKERNPCCDRSERFVSSLCRNITVCAFGHPSDQMVAIKCLAAPGLSSTPRLRRRHASWRNSMR